MNDNAGGDDGRDVQDTTSHDDAAADAGSESPEEGQAAADAAEDAVSGSEQK